MSEPGTVLRLVRCPVYDGSLSPLLQRAATPWGPRLCAAPGVQATLAGRPSHASGGAAPGPPGFVALGIRAESNQGQPDPLRRRAGFCSDARPTLRLRPRRAL